MKRLLIILLFLCLIETSAIAQFQQKPMLGVPIDPTRPLGDPVGAWFFNEGSGNKVFDLSGNGNDGTLLGGDVVWASGKFGSALSFPGTDQDYVNILGIVDNINTNRGAISAWINMATGTTSDSTNHIIVDAGDLSDDTHVLRLGKLADETIVLRYRVGGNNYNAVIPSLAGFENAWNHIVGVWDSGNVYIYLNGILIDSDTRAGGDIDGTQFDQAAIGALAQGGGLGQFTWKGLIENVMIWNRALSASEIALLYREPFGMFVKDDIVLLEAGIPTGVPVPVFYYHYVNHAAPLLPIIPFGLWCYLRRRKCVA